MAILVEQELDVYPLTQVHEDRIGAFDMSASEYLVSEKEHYINPRFYQEVQFPYQIKSQYT